jgi:hypothetical protein
VHQAGVEVSLCSLLATMNKEERCSSSMSIQVITARAHLTGFLRVFEAEISRDVSGPMRGLCGHSTKAIERAKL